MTRKDIMQLFVQLIVWRFFITCSITDEHSEVRVCCGSSIGRYINEVLLSAVD